MNKYEVTVHEPTGKYRVIVVELTLDEARRADAQEPERQELVREAYALRHVWKEHYPEGFCPAGYEVRRVFLQ